jgi:diguanylate cyclase (GGDEF)-like protein
MPWTKSQRVAIAADVQGVPGRRVLPISKMLFPLLGLVAAVGPVVGVTVLADRLIRSELVDRTISTMADDRRDGIEAAVTPGLRGDAVTVTVDPSVSADLRLVMAAGEISQLDLVRGDGTIAWSSADLTGGQTPISAAETGAFAGAVEVIVGATADGSTSLQYALPVRNAGSGAPVLVARATGLDDGQLVEAGTRAGALRSILIAAAAGLGLLAAVAVATGQLREWRRNERHRRLALHDGLTGLANRAHFHQRLGEAVAGGYRGKGKVGLVLIDLDGFKAINDTGGHGAGDRLLLRVATKLAEATRRHELPCRIGGDEFAVVVPNLKDRAELVQLADRLHAELDLMVDFTNGRSLRVTASMGLSVFPDDARTPDELVAAADVGMYRVKAGRKAMMHAAIGTASAAGPHPSVPTPS